ncbi:MAG TPA: hypothetical protein VNG93_04430 [Candidatus Dormibacteraeota bacterium]|nr:hypothetical protein [Candidatus Dormibacteraeota bacterium]
MISSSGVDAFIYSLQLALAKSSVEAAKAAVLTLLGAFGSGTEPDFQSVAPAYDRMLAIGLLLVVFFASMAIAEYQLGGSQGAGFSAIPRTLVACFAAFVGLALVGYLESYAALLATAWTPDFLGQNAHLDQVVSRLYSANQLSGPALGSVFGLMLTAVLTVLMALFVYIELVLRAALILITTTFIPLVATMWIWPRLAGAASHMAQFLVGLLLSKFVIATAVYVGYSIIVKGLVDGAGGAASTGMVIGLATLAVAALAPVVLLQGVHFGYQASAPLARGWAMAGANLASSAGQKLRGPTGRLIGAGSQRLPQQLAFLKPSTSKEATDA